MTGHERTQDDMTPATRDRRGTRPDVSYRYIRSSDRGWAS